MNMQSRPIASRAQRKNAGPELIRESILSAAGELLLQDGPHALSMRKLADRIGSSTIVLYTHFRDKQAILDALFREGFVRLRQHLEAVPQHADPMDHVVALGRAYRRSALAHAAAYQVMFTRCVPGFEPSAESRSESQRCFELLRDAVRATEAAGSTLPQGVTQTTQVLWGTLHGLISLELFGYLGSARVGEQRLEQAMQMLRSAVSAAASLKDQS